MGSSSKKHKNEKGKDSRKRKHRSRSRSPAERASRSELPERSERDREKHRHSKKHHKEKKRDKHSPSARDRNDYSNRLGKPQDTDSDDGFPTAPPPPKISRSSPPSSGAPAAASSSGDNSLSIAETNKLRAKLGLKPLQPAPSEVEEGSSTKTASELMGGKDMGEFVHKPAESLSQRKREEKIRSRLTERKEKRAIDAKLSTVRGIADEDSGDEDASAWVKRNRQIQQEKEKASKRAKMLEELDAEFGVGELVQDEFRNDASSAYSTRDLRGLKVEHSLDNFKEGRAVVLTLKDKGVLDEDDDVLVNVNIQDEERSRKNNERKKLKPNLHGYNAYDEESVDEFGNVQKSLLGKYDEEIGVEKKSSFVIGTEAEIERRQKEAVSIREKLQRKKLETLATAGLQLASEYYTPEEMVQFKKPKKKVRKIRKKVLKASDLESSLPEDGSKDLATRARDKPQTSKGGFKPVLGEAQDDKMDVEQGDSDGEGGEEFHLDIDDMPPPTEDLSNVKLEPDEGELELQFALNKARKLKQREDLVSRPSTAEAVALSILQLKQEQRDDEEGGHGGNITLNATAEFCRTLGDIPTYGLAGNRDEDAEELMDFEREMTEERRREAEERQQQRGAWAEVEVDEAPVEIAPPEAPILDEEPDVGAGVAGALRLAVSKGYLEKETSNRPSASRMHHLQAQNYSIEDKTHLDDDKFGRRERYAGPTSDFKEKDGFKPNVKLDYIDDDGRVLNAKEAFRYLSHKFHGKGPGKNKVEKRMKKVEQEVLMKQMSSTDTPLGTLNMLQQKQKETHSPYVVLSGSKQLQSISKTKM